MKNRIFLLALLLPTLALAQTPAKPPAAPVKDGAPISVNGTVIPRARIDMVARQQVERGTPDSEQLRAQVREALINNELLVQDANRSGIAKKPEVLQQIDLTRQEVIANATVAEYVRTHPITDADIQKEYERAKASTGDKEYKARHILVATEEEAKSVLADLKKGVKFDEIAQKRSLDEGSRSRGGDLDWNVPSNFDKAFADAMVKLEKGKMSDAPVRSRFGFHVILLEDVRAVNFPPLAQVKPQLQQRLTAQRVDTLIRELRAKAKIE